MQAAVFIFLLPLITVCDSARILALVLFSGRSHWIPIEPLLKELAARGHEITVFSPFPQKKPLPNYMDVDFSSHLPPLISTLSVDMIQNKMPNPWKTVFFMREVHSSSCKVLNQPVFKKLLNARGQYDLLVTQLFADDCFAYFAHILDVPLISITTSVNIPWASERTGLPDNPSYIPNYLVDFGQTMSFWERMYNTMILMYAKFYYLNVFDKQTRVIAEQALGRTLPPLNDVLANTSMLFLNSYHTLAQSRPFPPNVVEIGGIHVKKRQNISEVTLLHCIYWKFSNVSNLLLIII